MNVLQKIKDDMARSLYGQTAAEAQAQGLCLQCKRPAAEHCYSAAGKREFEISGLCEECFDSITKEEE